MGAVSGVTSPANIDASGQVIPGLSGIPGMPQSLQGGTAESGSGAFTGGSTGAKTGPVFNFGAADKATPAAVLVHPITWVLGGVALLFAGLALFFGLRKKGSNA